MGRRCVLTGIVGAVAAAVAALSLAVAQEGGEGGGARRRDPEGMRQRYMDRAKEAVSPTDEEWAKLEDPASKTVSLTMQPGVSGGMRLWGRRGGAEAEPQSDVAKAAAELQAAVDSGAAAGEISAKLAAYRTARDAARAELAAARETLKAMVTPTQEAALVLAGVLE